MPNTIITPTWVTKDVAMFWKNSIKLVGRFDRQWNKEWSKSATKLGDTIQVRIPQRFQVTEGQALAIQSIFNQTVPLSINHQYQVAFEWSSADAALRIEEVQKRYTKPAGQALANKADAQCGEEVYRSVYFSIGAPGVPLASDLTWTDGVALLRSAGVPEDLCAVTDPRTQSAITNANLALFGPRPVVDKAFRESKFAEMALGIDDWYYDPNMPTFTTGTFTTATPIVSGGGQTGSTILLAGMGTYAMVKGDVFTIDGVYMVNPVSYVDQAILQQFTLTAPLAGTTTGTFSISPPIITSGQLQTVTNSPGANAAVSWLGSTGTVAATMAAQRSKQSLVFQGDAFAFAMVDLPDDLPGAEATTITDPDARISLRRVRQYQALTDQLPNRIEMLVGMAPIIPSFALRAWS
ncbi:MAG TPA: P22 phage major capsid protein family protein [Vicinamibacterales bacterium]|nr:P22 phage major capsid protein family protein [Vicinamibacterales bacterium]